MTAYLARVTLTNNDGVPQDNAVNNWVFADSLGVRRATFAADITGLLEPFYQALYARFSPCLKRATGTNGLDIYDITTHLDGTPHGSPISSTKFGNTWAAAGGTTLPSDAACVVSFTGALIGTVTEKGSPTSIPSTESAIDQGAPATHTGTPRLKGRHRGRIYLGPLGSTALNTDASLNPVVDPTFAALIVTAAQNLITASAALTPALNWMVWSRRNAAMDIVAHGWVDNRFDTVRRRKAKSTIRLVY